MKAANLRVKSCLEKYSLDQGIRLLDDAVRTAKAAAEALGCSTSQIANSLIFRDMHSDGAVLIMCSGGYRVDLDKVQLLTGLSLGKADAEFVKAQSGFAIVGGIGSAHKAAAYFSRYFAAPASGHLGGGGHAGVDISDEPGSAGANDRGQVDRRLGGLTAFQRFPALV